VLDESLICFPNVLFAIFRYSLGIMPICLQFFAKRHFAGSFFKNKSPVKGFAAFIGPESLLSC